MGSCLPNNNKNFDFNGRASNLALTIDQVESESQRHIETIDRTPMENWHREQVSAWLDHTANTTNKKQIKRLIPVFHQHAISGMTLVTITKDQLMNELEIDQAALCELFIETRNGYIENQINQVPQLNHQDSNIEIEIKYDSSINETHISMTELFNKMQQFNMSSIKMKIVDIRPMQSFYKKHVLASIHLSSNIENNNNNIDTDTHIQQLSDIRIIDTNYNVTFMQHLQSFKSDTMLLFITSNDNSENKNNPELLFKEKCQHFLFQNYGIAQYMLLDESFDSFYGKYPFLCYDSEAKVSEEKVGDYEVHSNVQMVEMMPYKYPFEIIENQLFLGDYKQSEKIVIVQNLQITHILNVTQKKHENGLINVDYYQIPILDDESTDLLVDTSYLIDAMKWIETALNEGKDDTANRVLIHCEEGISRSATFVIAYLIYKNKQTFDSAFEYIRNVNPSVCPNESFRKQLRQFEQQII